MIVRDALLGELTLIRKQRILAYSEHAEKIPVAHWQALKQAITSEADAKEDVEVIVAELEGEIAGSVVLFPAKTDAYEGFLEELNYPEIRMLAVTPQARGKGVATGLIRECIQRSKGKGYTSIGLHTGEFMTEAMKLYEHLGFERLPQYDFEPANDGIIVKAYQLLINEKNE